MDESTDSNTEALLHCKSVTALEFSVPKAEWLYLAVIIAYFGAKIVFFAANIRERLFPDEASWFGMAEVFSRSILPPVDSIESYHLGLITHIPNLYFILMGNVLALNAFPSLDLYFLRGVNGLLGLMTIYVAWKLIVLLTKSRSVRLLFMVMLTNTIMFTFMFAAVNYDNLSTFLAVSALHRFIVFGLRHRVRDLLLFLIFIFAGILTKNVFIPYACALLLSLIVREGINLRRSRSMHIDWEGGATLSRNSLFVVMSVLAVFALKLYVGNLSQYGKLIPDIGQVLSVEQCLHNRLFARNYAANQFKYGRLTLVDAQRLALQIRDPGDRAFSWSLIEKARQEKKEAKKVRMGRLEYSVEWVKYVFTRTYGVAAHKLLTRDDRSLFPYYLVFAGAGIMLLIRLRWWAMRGFAGDLLWVAVFYALVLMQVVNYGNYLVSGVVGLALTGRYLFPVIVPIYALVSYVLMSKMPKWWQWSVGLLVGGVFIYGEFPWFLQNVTPDWYF